MNTYKFYYGANEVYAEISDKVQFLNNNINILYVPCLDMKRSILYGDPCLGVLKNVKILNTISNKEEVILKCNECAYILPLNDKIYVIKCLNDFLDILDYLSPEEIAQHKLDFIHSNLKLKYLDFAEYWLFQEEYPEQLLSARFLKGNERILEIGGNIGRNSLVMSYILKNSSLEQNNNLLVTLECSSEIAKHLKVNRDINLLNFFVEEFAISNRKLIQKDWDVHEFDHDLLDLPIGFSIVPTIDLQYLRKKYGVFDTLILDCEGSFYGILRDFPEILDGIKLIIMENDYQDMQNKIFIDSVLLKHNFSVKYEEKGGWGPCKEFFYQVWERGLSKSYLFSHTN
jgi:hypothetical protein